MSARQISQIVVLSFVVLGVLIAYVRNQAIESAETAQSDSKWLLKYELILETKPMVSDEDAEVLIHIGRPQETAYVEILDEDPKDYPFLVERRDDKRDLVIPSSRAKQYSLSPNFTFHVHSQRIQDRNSTLESLSSVSRNLYTRSDDNFPTESTNVRQVLSDGPPAEAPNAEKIEHFFNYCLTELDDASGDDEGDKVPWTLHFGRATPLGRAKVFVTLCRGAGIPARLVSGFALVHDNDAKPHVWAEVHRGNRWIPYDISNGHMHDDVIERYIPVRRGGDQVVWANLPKNMNIIKAKYSMTRLRPEEAVLNVDKRNYTQVLDLTRLPVEMHELVSLMLLLPFGALITAVFRNLVGLRTLGTFAPALLAMSFIYAAWGTGLVVLTVVVLIGLAGRNFLERMHLLMVPRLSIVLTLIIMCVAFGVSLLNYFSPGESAHAVLLPMVILTILIERFFVTAEEDGTGYALQLVLGTVVVAAFCYVILRWQDIGNLVLVYPEVHFLTIAAFILIGRYSGYRLTELWRFRDLAQDKS